MATYVLLLKEFEDENLVVYKFGPDRESLGKVQLNKKTGEYQQLEPVPNTQSTFYFNRAVARLLMCLNNENGVFPPQTHFAS